jgi:hypothetical protein
MLSKMGVLNLVCIIRSIVRLRDHDPIKSFVLRLPRRSD